MNTVLYRSGDAFLPRSILDYLEVYLIGNATSAFYVNVWSLVHFLSGVLTASLITPSLKTGFWIHTAWEFWQIFIGMTKYTTQRGAIDVVMDTAFFMAGMGLPAAAGKAAAR